MSNNGPRITDKATMGASYGSHAVLIADTNGQGWLAECSCGWRHLGELFRSDAYMLWCKHSRGRSL